MTVPLRVVVLDPHAAGRRVLRSALAGDGRCAVAHMDDAQADVVVVAVTASTVAPSAVVSEARTRYGVPLVVANCGAHLDVEERLALVASGASEVVTVGALRDGSLARADVDALVARLYRVAGRRPLDDDILCDPADNPGPGIIVIGVSTGGPPILREVLRTLPADYPIPIVVVQHMSDGFTAEFAEWLGHECALRVRVARAGDVAAAGDVLIAPEHAHTNIGARGWIALDASGRVGGHRPAADVLFESAARAYGARTLAIVLTGMGRDGTRGARAVHAAGGRVLVQDPATCAAPSMPESVRQCGIVSASASPAALSREIARIGRCAHRGAA